MSTTACCLKREVGASILNCNFVNIKQELKTLVEAGVDFVHLDVMDGNFVDDITFGPSFVASLIKEFPEVKFEVHMMVEEPEKFIEPMSAAKVKRFIFHYETTMHHRWFKYVPNVFDLVDKIHVNGMEAVIAIKPETPYQKLNPFLKVVDGVLVMTVHPGKGGQPFLLNMVVKIRALRQISQSLNIEVDGGISLKNINSCAGAGANRFVVGTALLNSEQKSQDVETMRSCLN